MVLDQVGNLQILDADDVVVFDDFGRYFLQVIGSGIADLFMDSGDFDALLLIVFRFGQKVIEHETGAANGLPNQNPLLLRGIEFETLHFVDDHGAYLLISYIIHERAFVIECEVVGRAKIFRQTNRLTPTDIHLPPTHWAMPASFLEAGVFCRIEDKNE